MFIKELFYLCFLIEIRLICGGNKVIELSDRFIELRGDTTWLVLFYAPWCGHCKKLEPVWNHVAQILYHSDIKVGRVDCTRFVAVATEYKIKGFPTILFFKGSEQHIFKGDRTEEEIVGFAQRMSSEPIPYLKDASSLQKTIVERKLFFVYIGDQKGALWDVYKSVSEIYRPFHFFYSANSNCLQKVSVSDSIPDSSVMVFKDNVHFNFSADGVLMSNITALNESLNYWVNSERFPSFLKITYGNLGHLWTLDTNLVITVVEESKIGSLKPEEREFREKVENLMKRNREKYHRYYQFGWTGTPDLANSIAMERLALPSLLVVNLSTMHHYIPDDEVKQMTVESIELFLESVTNQSITPQGGDTYFLRLYRNYYNARSSLEDMWSGNPVLTAVLFGLPLGFLSLICYSIWCSDILDAEDEDTEELHEKKD